MIFSYLLLSNFSSDSVTNFLNQICLSLSHLKRIKTVHLLAEMSERLLCTFSALIYIDIQWKIMPRHVISHSGTFVSVNGVIWSTANISTAEPPTVYKFTDALLCHCPPCEIFVYQRPVHTQSWRVPFMVVFLQVRWPVSRAITLPFKVTLKNSIR